MVRKAQIIVVCALFSACQVPKTRSPPPLASTKPPNGTVVPGKTDWDAELLRAAKVGDYEAATVALRNGASPNTRGFYDVSPLIEAADGHDTKMAKLLLDHDADPNQEKADGVTPLFLATAFPPANPNDLSLPTILIDKGAKVDRPNQVGQTPLLWVAFYGHIPIADFLLSHGANINVVDDFRDTPLSMAEGQHRNDMVSFLLSHGATRP